MQAQKMMEIHQPSRHCQVQALAVPEISQITQCAALKVASILLAMASEKKYLASKNFNQLAKCECSRLGKLSCCEF